MQKLMEVFQLKREPRFYLRALTFCAVLIALAVVSEMIIPAIPLSGLKNGDKVNPASAFMIIAGLMFGPIWGGLAAIVEDLVGCILKGDAPLPQFIIAPFLTAFCAGLFSGFLPKLSKKLYGIIPFCAIIATAAFLLNSYFIVTTYALKSGFWTYCLLRLPTLPIKIALYSVVVYVLYVQVLPRITLQKATH